MGSVDCPPARSRVRDFALPRFASPCSAKFRDFAVVLLGGEGGGIKANSAGTARFKNLFFVHDYELSSLFFFLSLLIFHSILTSYLVIMSILILSKTFKERVRLSLHSDRRDVKLLKILRKLRV